MSKQLSTKVNRAAASARLVNRSTGQQAVSMYELDRNRVLMQFCFVKFDQIVDSQNARLTTEYGVAELAATILKSGGWKQVNNMLFCPEDDAVWAQYCPYYHWLMDCDNRAKANLPLPVCPLSDEEVATASSLKVKALDGHHRRGARNLLLKTPEKLLSAEFLEFQIDWSSVNAPWIKIDVSGGAESVSFGTEAERATDINFFPESCWGTILRSMPQEEIDILSDQVNNISAVHVEKTTYDRLQRIENISNSLVLSGLSKERITAKACFDWYMQKSGMNGDLGITVFTEWFHAHKQLWSYVKIKTRILELSQFNFGKCCSKQSLIELAKWHKSFVQSAPGAAEVQSPHAEEVILSTLDYLETFFESKKSCMIGPVVAELARYLSAQISLRDRTSAAVGVGVELAPAVQRYFNSTLTEMKVAGSTYTADFYKNLTKEVLDLMARAPTQQEPYKFAPKPLEKVLMDKHPTAFMIQQKEALVQKAQAARVVKEKAAIKNVQIVQKKTTVVEEELAKNIEELNEVVSNGWSPNFARRVKSCNNDNDEHVQAFLQDWVQTCKEADFWDGVESATIYTAPDYQRYDVVLMDCRHQPDCTFQERQDMAAFKANIIKCIEALKRSLSEEGVLVLFVGTDCISFFSDCFWGDCSMHYLPGTNHKVLNIMRDTVTDGRYFRAPHLFHVLMGSKSRKGSNFPDIALRSADQNRPTKKFIKSNVYGSKLDSISGVCAPRYGRQYHVQGPPYVIVVRGLEATEPMERDAVPEDVVNEVLERIAPQPGQIALILNGSRWLASRCCLSAKLRTMTTLPETLALANLADNDHCLELLKEHIVSDLSTTWQFCRKQGLYESVNILKETVEYVEPKPWEPSVLQQFVLAMNGIPTFPTYLATTPRKNFFFTMNLDSDLLKADCAESKVFVSASNQVNAGEGLFAGEDIEEGDLFGVMWGEILVTTLSEVSDMGDENLKGCAERVLEITYNPIVFTKTTPDNMKQKVFLIGSKSCAASYANSVALVHGKETFVDGFTCPNKDAMDPFTSDYVYNARLVCHIPKGVADNGFESFSDYYHFIKSCPVGYVARRKIYKNEEIITNYPVGDCSYEDLPDMPLEDNEVPKARKRKVNMSDQATSSLPSSKVKKTSNKYAEKKQAPEMEISALETGLLSTSGAKKSKKWRYVWHDFTDPDLELCVAPTELGYPCGLTALYGDGPTKSHMQYCENHKYEDGFNPTFKLRDVKEKDDSSSLS